jgi:hypothetical protein
VRARDLFERERDAFGPEWLEAAGMSDDFAMLTPASVIALRERVAALLRELETEDADAPGRERVSLHMALFPSRTYPL